MRDLCQLQADGDLPVSARLVGGVELVAQKLRLALGRHVGETLRDAADGVPFLDWMQVRPFPRGTARGTLVQRARDVRGVGSVEVVSDSFNEQSGTYSLALDVYPDGEDDSVRVGIEVRGPTGNLAPWAGIIIDVS